MNPYTYSSSANKTTKMSSQSDTTGSESHDTNQEKQAETNNNDTTEQETKQVKPMKKVKSKKDLKNDPNRFEVPGVNFNAKLIGIDDVESARGDKMCQESMARLKIAVKTSGQHKQKIIINVSLDGIRIIDVRTQANNHTHPVHRISFISRDITDARAFGYVYGAGEGKHKFFAIKTEKAAEALVLTLRDLFQVVYEMKKKEVEEAKNKIEEPEKATEAEEGEEPVYSVVDKSKPAGEGSETTYQVPTNNAPVVEDSHDLLNLENELETIEKRIEQIDTMEELFKELEAPPPASQASTTTSTSNWASDLAGLSSAPNPQVAQNQGMFSMGGAPFPPASQGFGTQPFGMPAAQAQPAGFGGMHTQPAGVPMMAASFGAAPNPFQTAPSVPPRTGMGFGGQASGFPAQPFPGTPFPGTQPQAPGFPQAPGMPPTQAGLPVSADPFGNDPFAVSTGFGEPLLEPAKLEVPKEEAPPTNTKKDAFGDLVDIGHKDKQTKSPKDLFADLSALPKRSLNELKVEPAPKKPASPVGSHASGDEAFPPNDPAFPDNDPFGSSDPFADDPFASSGSISKSSLEHSKNNHASQSLNQTLPEAQQSPFKTAQSDAGGNYNLPSPEGPPPPLPEGPPPPLPEGPPPPLPQIPPPPLPKGPPPPLPTDLVSPESHYTPVLPPRPVIDPPVNPHPPVPPRPKSASSDSTKGSMSSLNSLTESQPQATPPVPPRTKPANTTTDIVPVPRPRPRPSSQSASSQPPIGRTNKTSEPKSRTEKPVLAISNHVNNGSELDKNDNEIGARTKMNSMHSKDPFCDIDRKKVNEVESQWSVNSKVDNTHNQSSSSAVKSDKKILKTNLSTCSVSDPFVNTDPFASDDPFTQADPFAVDPFAPDPFSDPISTSSQSPNDPFTSIVASPKVKDESDPFSVFDNTFSSDTFKFDKSSSRKVKLKVSGQ